MRYYVGVCTLVGLSLIVSGCMQQPQEITAICPAGSCSSIMGSGNQFYIEADISSAQQDANVTWSDANNIARCQPDDTMGLEALCTTSPDANGVTSIVAKASFPNGTITSAPLQITIAPQKNSPQTQAKSFEDKSSPGPSIHVTQQYAKRRQLKLEPKKLKVREQNESMTSQDSDIRYFKLDQKQLETNPLGSDTASLQISGQVMNLADPQDLKLCIYTRTDHYYVQPDVSDPLTDIDMNGNFSTEIHPGEKYYALIVKPDYVPDAILDNWFPHKSPSEIVRDIGRIYP